MDQPRPDLRAARRRFLSFVLGSPLLLGQPAADSAPIKGLEEALNLLDFEGAARKVLPPAHYGYLATGVEDDITLRANRQGFSRYYLRPRRLVDGRNTSLRIEIFGTAWDAPIGFAPIGNTMAFHPEGEAPVCRAARAKNVLQILSTNSNISVKKAAAERGAPVWYQLYVPANWTVLEQLVRHAEDAGSPAIAVTVDTQSGRRTDTFERLKRLDTRDCTTCHGSGVSRNFFARKMNFEGIDMKGIAGQDSGMTWDTLRKIRKLSTRKLLVKGIETLEDAKTCVDAEVDGIIVSNHGGRAGETGRGTIEALPEVLEGAGKRIPVFIDGGFRRGSDVFKALALGASAVFIGRPYIWGLAAFGQPGVERVIEMIRTELLLVMKQCGVQSVAQINRSYIGERNS